MCGMKERHRHPWKETYTKIQIPIQRDTHLETQKYTHLYTEKQERDSVSDSNRKRQQDRESVTLRETERG